MNENTDVNVEEKIQKARQLGIPEATIRQKLDEKGYVQTEAGTYIKAEKVPAATGLLGGPANFLAGLLSGGKSYEARGGLTGPYKTYVPPQTPESELGANISGFLPWLLTLSGLGISTPSGLKARFQQIVSPSKLTGSGQNIQMGITGELPLSEKWRQFVTERLGTAGRPNLASFTGKKSILANADVENLIKQTLSNLNVNPATGQASPPTFGRLWDVAQEVGRIKYSKEGPVDLREPAAIIKTILKQPIHAEIPWMRELDKRYAQEKTYEEAIRYPLKFPFFLLRALRFGGG